MTGQERRDADADGAVVAADVGVVDECRPSLARLAVPARDHAGNRVATETSRGVNAAVVAPGRALGNRRTTAPGVVGMPGAPPAVADICVRPPLVLTAAAAVPGATVRIAEDDDGLTVAVVRSSRLLPAARNNAGPRAAATAASAADLVRASPLIDASASPAAGAYDGERRPAVDAASVADCVAVIALSGVRLDGDDVATAGRVADEAVGDPVELDDGAAVVAAAAAAG